MAKSRIYVGNLSIDTEEKHIKKEFSSFGIVSNLEFKNKCDIEGNPIARFAYLNLESDNAQINQCVRALNGSTLNGYNIKVEIARESFLDRLKREREQKEEEENLNKSGPKPSKAFNENDYNFVQQPKSWQRDKPNYENSYNNQNDWNNFDLEARNESRSDYDGYRPKHSNRSDTNFNANFEPLGQNSRGDFKAAKSNRSYDNFNANFEPLGPNKLMDFKQNDQSTPDSPLLGGGHANQIGQKLLSGVLENVKDKRYDSKNSKISSAFKRYDPTAENQQKHSVEISKTSAPKSFSEVSSDLKFTKNSSSFSLLSKFSELSEKKQDIEAAFNNQKEQFTEEEEEEEEEVRPAMTQRLPNRHNVVPKSRNFFIQAHDSTLQEGVNWLLTPLTDENRKEFEDIRRTLLSFCKRRKVRAERFTDDDNRIKENGLQLMAKSRKKTDEYWERNKRNMRLRSDWINKKDKKFNKKDDRKYKKFNKRGHMDK